MVISHGGVCRVINSYFESLDNEDFSSLIWEIVKFFNMISKKEDYVKYVIK